MYFISGMCYGCNIFDGIKLPTGFEKQYIEWLSPIDEEESLHQYSRQMAAKIDISRPFILVGYSFGAIIMQEMNSLISPAKNIVISSMKNEREIPKLFRMAEKTRFAELVPTSVFEATKFIMDIFSKTIYKLPIDLQIKYMTFTNPLYIKWAVHQITNWRPKFECLHLHHIHGADDQIFPAKQITKAHIVEGADHLMIITHGKEVNSFIDKVLLEK